MLRFVSDVFPKLMLYSWRTYRLLSPLLSGWISILILKAYSIRIESCCPNTIINIIKLCCVCLAHHCIFIYVLNTSGWQILKKFHSDIKGYIILTERSKLVLAWINTLTLILLTWRIWWFRKMLANGRWDLNRRLTG